jgi:hypothetical protein
VVAAVGEVVAGGAGLHEPSVGRSLASGFAAFGTGILTLGSRGRLALRLALRILAVAGGGDDMALAESLVGETPERALLGALVGGGGDALEGLEKDG